MKTGDIADAYPLIRIILADDDPDDCYLFREALQELDLQSTLDIVNDGDELLGYLRKTTSTPDILFLDLNMPKRNGCVCLQEIRKNPQRKDLSIVMYSTSLDENLIQTLSANGANHFIRKPSAFDHLKKLIRHTLEVALKEKLNPLLSSHFVITTE